ncbi:MAG: hypothetical protein R3220_00300 [Balneolaceae bacterium]|nr:hypothetical protein [Balneolaceae bacterium]
MFKKSFILIALALLMSGCYHAQVTTGLEESNQVYKKAWATSFIAGLIPPATIDATEHCNNGVAKVETRHSFLNLVAQAITFSIFSPMEITVTCASASADISADSQSLELAVNSSDEVKQNTYSEAVAISAKTNKPVYVNIK